MAAGWPLSTLSHIDQSPVVLIILFDLLFCMMHEKLHITDFTCYECDAATTDVYRHYANCHPCSESFKCNLCSTKYTRIYCLVRHHKVKHMGMATASVPTPSNSFIPNQLYSDQENDDPMPPNQEIARPRPTPTRTPPIPITETSALFLCSLLHEPTIPVIQVFNIVENVEQMYAPLISYLHSDVLPSLDENQRPGKLLIIY